MARTLSDILIDVNAFVNKKAEEPTGSELTLRKSYATRAIWDAQNKAQLREFTDVRDVATPSSTTTLTTVSLGTYNFKEFTEIPYIVGEPSDKYEEIRPQDRGKYGYGDKYCYVLGNPQEGYHAIFHNLTPNKTLALTFQRFPSGFATLTDKCELPDPTYVSTKVESYILQSSRDDRFPTVDSVAELKLSDMVGRNMKYPSGGVNRTRSTHRNPMS